MPETQERRREAGHKAAATRKRHELEREEHEHASAVDRTTELSEAALQSIESAQRTVIEAVRNFLDTVDEMLPAIGERPSRRQEVVDAAMEMADHLVHTQYDFLRNILHSAGKALGERHDGV